MLKNVINRDRYLKRRQGFSGRAQAGKQLQEPGSGDGPAFGVRGMSIKCKICESEMLLDDSVECPFCGELFCSNHVMACDACGKSLCVDCMEYPEDEPICPECEKMLQGD